MEKTENVEKVEKVEKVKRKLVDRVSPFPLSERQRTTPVAVRLRKDSKICLKPVAKVIDGKPGMTVPDFSDQVTVQSIVDSYKDECGLAYALRQINQGRLMPTQLMDKGDRSGDVSNLPDNVNDAYQLAKASASDAEKVATDLGISHIDQAQLDKIVSDAVQRKFEAVIAANKEVKKDE